MADALPSDLSKVDPADAWQPWDGTGWNRKWAAHLFRRAAFGPTPADADRALAEGFPATLNRLLAGDPGAAELQELLTETGEYCDTAEKLRTWWLYGMQESAHPLREKLTLFWHNHFATSVAKVQSPRLMFQQNLVLRTHALGRFRPFLLAMSRDTAMLKWLDSNRNTKAAPNENYAREVMELFSLGVGNYTEKDVQEAARAFTGWHHDIEEKAFEFKPAEHDPGEKRVFNKAGAWGGEDVVRMCCDHPACAPFLVGKLYAFLVSETPPPKALLAPLAERFRASDYDIADVVRAVLGSRLFFSPHAYRKRVKWPVEYALGAVRAVVPDRVPPGDLVEPLAKMGQALFAPPNVKGWRTGTDWLNSATLLARNNFAESVATARWQRAGGGNKSDARAVAVTAVDSAVAVAEPTAPLPPAAAVAAVGAAPAVYGGPTVTGPDRVEYLALVVPPAVPPSVPDAPVTSAAQPPAPPAQPVEARLDPVAVLFATKPKSPAELVTRIGELVYGDDVPAAARAKVEKFLLEPAAESPAPAPKPDPKAKAAEPAPKTVGKADPPKKAPAPKGPPKPVDMASEAFKQKAREALHALMCLPEYQLG